MLPLCLPSPPTISFFLPPQNRLQTLTLGSSLSRFFLHTQAPRRIPTSSPLRSSLSGETSSALPLYIEEIVERDWSFLDLDAINSDEERRRKTHLIISAGGLREKSRVLVCMGGEWFVDRLVESAPTCELLLFIHESLFALAMIKEKYDTVRCWQGEISALPQKFSPFDTVLACYFPGMGVTLDRLLSSAAGRCSPAYSYDNRNHKEQLLWSMYLGHRFQRRLQACGLESFSAILNGCRSTITRSVKILLVPARSGSGICSQTPELLERSQDWIGEGVWADLNREWSSTAYKQKSAQNKKNQASECGGMGTSLSTCGPVPITEHMRRMVKELGRDPTFTELHTRTQKKGTQQWVDERAMIVNDEYLRLRDEQSSIDSSDSPSDLSLWNKAVGGKKKGRTYGLGAQGPAFDVQGLSYTSSPYPGQSSMDQMREEMQAHQTDMEKRLQDQIEEQQRKHQEEMRKQQEDHQLAMQRLLDDVNWRMGGMPPQ